MNQIIGPFVNHSYNHSLIWRCCDTLIRMNIDFNALPKCALIVLLNECSSYCFLCSQRNFDSRKCNKCHKLVCPHCRITYGHTFVVTATKKEVSPSENVCLKCDPKLSKLEKRRLNWIHEFIGTK